VQPVLVDRQVLLQDQVLGKGPSKSKEVLRQELLLLVVEVYVLCEEDVCSLGGLSQRFAVHDSESSRNGVVSSALHRRLVSVLEQDDLHQDTCTSRDPRFTSRRW